MSDTLSSLNTAVSAAIKDPGHNTFTSAEVDVLVNAALAEIGRLAPERFQEDITVTADTLSYIVRKSVYTNGNPLVEVRRVEVWDKTATPNTYVCLLQPASRGASVSSQSGWEFWGGVLFLTNAFERWLDPDKHVLRVQGYAPYPELAGLTAITLPAEHRYALLDYARLEALKSLAASRDLFTQWQTASHNTDVSPAALLSQLNLATQAWERRSRHLMVLREAN